MTPIRLSLKNGSQTLIVSLHSNSSVLDVVLEDSFTMQLLNRWAVEPELLLAMLNSQPKEPEWMHGPYLPDYIPHQPTTYGKSHELHDNNIVSFPIHV